MKRFVATLLFSSMLIAAAPGQEVTQIVKRPLLKEAPQPFPEAALKGGHNGTVLVSGTLGVDGIFRDATVKQSSGSEILDAAAVNAVKNWIFSPAYDAGGTPVEVPITADVEYTKAFAEDYTCQQFVLDSDWHDRVRGKDHRSELRIYKTLRGFGIAALLSSKHQSMDDFDKKWDGVISYCRENPDQKFRKAFSRQS